jgi:gas vesicle protein
MEASMLAGIGAFGAGVVIGGGVALLFAPKPGRELRDEIFGAVRGAPAEIRDRYERLRDRLTVEEEEDVGFDGAEDIEGVEGEDHPGGGR